MPIPSMEVWVLTFFLTFPDSFVGGEYQSYGRCQLGAQQQLHHWRIIYGPNIRYKCETASIAAKHLPKHEGK
jgi:hypothetical protein